MNDGGRHPGVGRAGQFFRHSGTAGRVGAMITMTRRRLLQGGAAAMALGWLRRPARAAAEDEPLELEIGMASVTITGQPSRAVAVNGGMPGPTLRWREGDMATIAVTNRLSVPTSIHWHGVRTPSAMDGVPGLSFPGIAPGERFVYRFPLRQSGTYWYHGHWAFQEQSGLLGAIVIEPRDGYVEPFDREHIVMLSDWTDEAPETILSNLKFDSDYYNRGQRTLGDFMTDARKDGIAATLSDRLAWGKMRMSPTDILDVSGATYRYLINGLTAESNWTGLFTPGERLKLRFINASSMSIFDVRIPDLPMMVVAADGNDVAPIIIDQFRLSAGETLDVIVTPTGERAFTIVAQAEDRSGVARGTLTARPGLSAPVPPMDPRALRSMADMGMGGMEMGMAMDMPLKTGVTTDNVAMMPSPQLDHAGGETAGRRVLRYADLRAIRPGLDPRPPSREITLHLTGNMERFIWGFDGKRLTDAEPIHLALNERVRVTLINDTMMEHPVHLHGLWSELENGQEEFRPYKHTLNVKPAETLSFLVTADTPGRWAFHCHLLFHMATGMFREVHVA